MAHPMAYDNEENIKKLNEFFRTVFNVEGDTLTSVNQDNSDYGILKHENQNLNKLVLSKQRQLDSQAKTIQELQGRVEHLKAIAGDVNRNWSARLHECENEKEKIGQERDAFREKHDNYLLTQQSQADFQKGLALQWEKNYHALNARFAERSKDLYDALEISDGMVWDHIIDKISMLVEFRKRIDKVYEEVPNVGSWKG